MADKKIVLAVDDNLQQLSEYKNILIPKYDLRIVKSAAEAMAFLYRNFSDIILLDIEMPNVSGFEFLEDIRKIPSYLEIPIIIVSGNNSSEFFAKAKKSSAADVLIKPIKPETLIQTIEKALGTIK